MSKRKQQVTCVDLFVQGFSLQAIISRDTRSSVFIDPVAAKIYLRPLKYATQ